MKYKVMKLNRNILFMVLIIAVGFSSSLGVLKKTASVSKTERLLPIYSVETTDKKIAITFDAAWESEDTDTLISILNKHNAKATFFVVGDWVTNNPKQVKKLFCEGHEIGNHSDTHPLFSKIPREKILKEIENCNKKIEQITKVKTRLLRAPSGDYDNKSIEATKGLNMEMIQWDVDSLDWKKLSVQDIYNRVIKKTKNGSILLFHNGVKNTPIALDKILTELSKKGYEFVTVSDLIYKENYEIDFSGKQKPLN